MVCASYATDIVLMLAFSAAGGLEMWVPLAYAGAAAAACAGFYVMFSSNWTERFSDHYISLPYLLVHSAINLSCIALAPKIGTLLLMVLFVIFAFASLRMSLRHMLFGMVTVALVVAFEIAWLGDRLSLPMATWPQRAIVGLWFTLILLRTSLLGLYSSQLRELLAKRNLQLADTFVKLDDLATRDELTGVLNRRAIMQLFEDERQRMLRTGQVFAIALLDLDHFKQVNDNFGHLVGDEVLRCFSRIVVAGLRNTDRLGRYGGEEFLVLFTTTAEREVVIHAMDRIRQEVATYDWNSLTRGNPVTVSAGVAICQKEEAVEQLLSRADMALYQAKHDGRNCICFGASSPEA